MGLKVDTDTLMTKQAQEGRVRIPREIVETIVDCAVNVAHDIFREEIDYAIGNFIDDYEKNASFNKYERIFRPRGVDDIDRYIGNVFDNNSKLDFVELASEMICEECDVFNNKSIDNKYISNCNVFLYNNYETPCDETLLAKALKACGGDDCEVHVYYSYNEACYKVLKIQWLEMNQENDYITESFTTMSKISKKLDKLGYKDIKAVDFYTDEDGLMQFLIKFSI